MTKLQSGERERLLRLGKKTGSVLFRIFRVYLILALSFVVLYPIFYLISMSFRPVEEFTNPSIIWVPETWTLDILKKAWEAVDFPVSLRNTVIFALSNTVFSILPCCLAGYGFARFQFKGKRLLFVCLIISIIVPAQTIIVPLYVRMRYFDFFFLGQLGRLFTGAPFTVKLLDSYGAMWFLSLLGNGLRGGMFIFIFRQFFTSMPQDLEDAAYVDGAGFFSTFLRVIVPCASAPFLVVFILSLIWHWNDTFMSTLLDSSRTTLAFAIQNLTQSSGVGANSDVYTLLQTRLASCIYLITPLLIVYLFLQKYFIQSIDRTGLK